MTKKMTFLDKAFWITESDSSPKHVSCIQILRLPDNKKQSYVDELVTAMRRFDHAMSPFNCRVVAFLKFPIKMVEVTTLDMEYHLQHHEIDNVEDSHQLNSFVAKLHEKRLDPKQPLWQYHVIKSTQGSKFAIYIKIHHIYGDGASLVKWFQGSYEKSPSDNLLPVWAMDHTRKKRFRNTNKWMSFLKGTMSFIIASKDLLWVICRVLFKLVRINKDYMPVPFTGTKTVLTGQVTPGRVIATTDFNFKRIQILSKRMRATINEVLLCIFDIGVHKYLAERGQIFKKPLYTNMPINLRKPGDTSTGNKIAIVPVALAHGEADPYLRLRQIIENHRIVKKAALKAHPASFSYYTVLIQSIALIYEMLRLSDVVKPIANILISNVPGPMETRYFKDCQLDAVYPISTITPGGGVNITLLTYDETANIGLVCCSRDIDNLEPMAQYFQDAFDLLESSVEDSNISIDDIGEHVIDKYKSVIEE
jgi:diacylglycerol O-acyltransferase / wax synthase